MKRRIKLLLVWRANKDGGRQAYCRSGSGRGCILQDPELLSELQGGCQAAHR